MPEGGLIQQFRGDLLLHELGPEGLVQITDSLHIQKIDDSHEGFRGPPGNLEGDRTGPKGLVHFLHGSEEIGSEAVHFVDKGDAGHTVPLGLVPNGFGLRLHPANGAEHGHGSVEHPQGTLDLGGKVHVSGGVDEVDLLFTPETGRGGGGDGDAAFLLLGHPVHRGCTLVHLAELVVDPRIVEDALGDGRLPGIDVGHDADIAKASERVGLGHDGLITSDSGRTPCWPRPSCACLRAS